MFAVLTYGAQRLSTPANAAPAFDPGLGFILARAWRFVGQRHERELDRRAAQIIENEGGRLTDQVERRISDLL